MASFIYKGEDELVFPTLGLVVKSGDTFDAPDNVAGIAGVSSAKTKSNKNISDVADATPIEGNE